MLVTRYIRENKKTVLKQLKLRGFDASNIVERLIKEDDNRKNVQLRLDELLTHLNRLNKEIGVLYKNEKNSNAEQCKKETVLIKKDIKKLQQEHILSNKKVHEIL